MSDGGNTNGRAIAQAPRRGDPSLILRMHELDPATARLRHLAGRDCSTMSMALRGCYILLSLLIVENGGPLVVAGRDAIIANRLSITAGAWSAFRKKLSDLEALFEEGGGVMTDLARWELERRVLRARRHAAGGQAAGGLRAAGGRAARRNGEKARSFNDRALPPPACAPSPSPSTPQEGVEGDGGMRLTPRDGAFWRDWLDHLQAVGRSDLCAAATERGTLLVPARHPGAFPRGAAVPLPTVPPEDSP